jgi:DNA-binding CsgD family transcriptional regulator
LTFLLADKNLIERLSLAEWRVYNEAITDKPRKEIARDLHLSLRTIKFHLSSIYRKLGLSGRLDLVYFHHKVKTVKIEEE